jgi:hypothetical protein
MRQPICPDAQSQSAVNIMLVICSRTDLPNESVTGSFLLALATISAGDLEFVFNGHHLISLLTGLRPA